MPKAIKQLADRYLTNPAEVSVTPVASTVDRVQQRLTFVNQAEKTALLIDRLRSDEVERALVFSRTKHGADKIVRLLEAAGLPANAIHGNKSQPQRERAIGEFRSGEVNILVATDIAARGIDIPGVSHVFNYDLPDVPEQYVHRIGRTARAGANGVAIAFCSPEERGNLRDIERLTKQKLIVKPLPEDFTSIVAVTKALRPATPTRGGGRRSEGSRDHRPNRHPAHRGNARPAQGNRRRRGQGRRTAS
jgi:ATP-dependent RNA helicase RhlE